MSGTECRNRGQNVDFYVTASRNVMFKYDNISTVILGIILVTEFERWYFIEKKEVFL